MKVVLVKMGRCKIGVIFVGKNVVYVRCSLKRMWPKGRGIEA